MGVMAQDEAKGMLPDKSPPLRDEPMLDKLRGLNDAYGWKLLAILAAAQWMGKGFIWGLCLSTMDFLFRDYAVAGPRLQVYKAIVMLPWAMKPLFSVSSVTLCLSSAIRRRHT